MPATLLLQDAYWLDLLFLESTVEDNDSKKMTSQKGKMELGFQV